MATDSSPDIAASDVVSEDESEDETTPPKPDPDAAPSTVSSKGLLQKIREAGPAAKKKVDDWLESNVNEPLAEAGHPDIGAGISAVGSAAADMAIPEDEMDLAMAALPIKGGGKAIKAAKEALNYEKWAGKIAPKVVTEVGKGFQAAQPAIRNLDAEKAAATTAHNLRYGVK